MALGIASGSGVVALVSPIPWKAEEKESRTSGRFRLEAVNVDGAEWYRPIHDRNAMS